MNPAWRHLSGLGTTLESIGSTAARQEYWLFDCLHRNRSTDYGKQYYFDEIRSIRDFRKRVPMISYDDVKPHIQRMSAGEADVLFAGLPVAFERTGGSTRGSKLIPYSPHSLRDFQAALLPWLGNSIQQFGITSGTAYFSISPATRKAEVSAGGIPIGLPDGAYLGAEALSEFAQISAVPAWAGTLHDVKEWQLATLYWLLCRDDLALISVWSPTFMLTLLDALERRSEELASLLQHGGALTGHALPPNPDALARLSRFTSSRDAGCLWPNLKLVSCWADASSRPFVEQLRQRLPRATFQGKGLLSTEGVVTVPDRSGLPVLALDSGFFEFLSESGGLCLGNEVIEGETYEVVMTTSGGLYRYRTGDCVICEGFAEDIPVLRFSGRKGLTSDIVGEKLDEGFVLSCLEDVTGFGMLVPVRVPGSRYVLVVDKQYEHESGALIDLVEARLFRNPQYAYARSIGQLDKLDVYKASQPLDKYIGRLAAAGARLGDLKVAALRPETDWLDTFSGTAE